MNNMKIPNLSGEHSNESWLQFVQFDYLERKLWMKSLIISLTQSTPWGISSTYRLLSTLSVFQFDDTVLQFLLSNDEHEGNQTLL